MRLVSYRFSAHSSQLMAGVLDGNGIVNAGLLLGRSAEMTMLGLLNLGPAALSRLNEAMAEFNRTYTDQPMLPEAMTAPVWLTEIVAPLPRPRSFRDFYAYEQHVAAGYAKRSRPIPPAWFEMPVFFYQHPGNMYGSDATIPYPRDSAQLDFELEIAAVIGKGGRDISATDGWSHVAGLTILNDWSARDLQLREMSVGLGPAKSKDFATSIGPTIVTLDELEPWFQNDRHHLAATVAINDIEIASTNTGDNYWTVPQMIEFASRGVDLQPGDLIGLGTMARGCLLELGEAVHPWLRPGDEVVLEVEQLGRLRSMIGE
ncbi:fumarylacetoacetate hydrolase family protein [soil metagenome]